MSTETESHSQTIDPVQDNELEEMRQELKEIKDILKELQSKFNVLYDEMKS